MGPRIYLAKHALGLAPEMFHLIDKNRQFLSQFMPWAVTTKTVKSSKAWILRTQEGWKDGTLFDYGIFLRDQQVYIGSAGIHTLAWENRCAEFGYWLGKDFEGQGYISEALELLEKVIFEKGFHRVEIRCAQDNQRSAAVARRRGYEQEGLLRENVLFQGQFQNTLIFAKLASAGIFCGDGRLRRKVGQQGS